MTKKQYDAFAADIAAGKMVESNGRTAASMADLDFIATAEKNAKTGKADYVPTAGAQEQNANPAPPEQNIVAAAGEDPLAAHPNPALTEGDVQTLPPENPGSDRADHAEVNTGVA